jgi:hypothetical protein
MKGNKNQIVYSCLLYHIVLHYKINTSSYKREKTVHFRINIFGTTKILILCYFSGLLHAGADPGGSAPPKNWKKYDFLE